MQLDDIKQELRSHISILQQTLNALENVNGYTNGTAGHKNNLVSTGRPKRHMSASSRARIAAAQRARWAKWKKAQKRAA